MSQSIHDTMKILAIGQTWMTENDTLRKILDIEFIGAYCRIRYRCGRVIECHSDTFAAWVNRTDAKLLDGKGV